MCASRPNHVRKEALQVERFRSGIGRRARVAHQAMTNRAEQANFTARRAKNRVDQIGRGCLSVCPGHANEFQNFSGASEIVCRGDGQRFPCVGNPNPGEIGRDRSRVRLLAGNGDCSAGDGIGNKIIPVRFFAANSNKKSPRLYLAAVVSDFLDFQITLRGRNDCLSPPE